MENDMLSNFFSEDPLERLNELEGLKAAGQQLTPAEAEEVSNLRRERSKGRLRHIEEVLEPEEAPAFRGRQTVRHSPAVLSRRR